MALVGHWPLNGNANDYSGYINHGTPHSDVNWVDGKIGLALSDSYVTIPNAEHLQTIGKTTIAFWIYAKSSTNRRTIIDKAYGGEFTINLETNGRLRFYCGLAGKNDSPYSSVDSSVLPKNKWVHAVLVRDGKTATWYLNGEKDTTGTNDNFIGTKSNNNIRLLTGYTGGIADALLNDVRIYDHVLSEFEIKELAKAKILHYTFDNPEEEPVENLWSGGLNIYNNYGVPATLTILDNETFMGYPIYRLGMTVDDEHADRLNHFRTSLFAHGVYGGYYDWDPYTPYVSSIYWRPVNKMDVEVGGTASNIGGWKAGENEYLDNGWRRYYRYRLGDGTSTKRDPIHHSFRCPSLELNETVYIDFACPQTIAGRTTPTPYTPDVRIGYGFVDLTNYTLFGSGSTIKKEKNYFEFEKTSDTANTGIQPNSDKRHSCKPGTWYTYEFDLWCENTTTITIEFKNTRMDGGSNPSGNSNITDSEYYPSISYTHPAGSWVHYAYSFKTRDDYYYHDYSYLALGAEKGKRIVKNLRFYQGKFNERNIIRDISGFKNDGITTTIDKPIWSDDSAIGDGSFEFNGKNSKIITPPIIIGDEMTYSFWYKKNISSNMHLIDHRKDDWGIQPVYISSSNYIQFYDSETGSLNTSEGIAKSDNEWHHIAVVGTPTSKKIYHDGELIATSSSGITPMSPRSIFIGCRFNQTNFFNGFLDDVRVYATALSDEDIKMLYKKRASIDNYGNLHVNNINLYLKYDPSVNIVNLVRNGNAEYGNNENFSSLEYDANEKCFKITGRYNHWECDDFIKINGNGLDKFDSYVLEGEFKQNKEPMSRYYFMLACYDKYKRFISYEHHMTLKGTETRLARDLNNGDEYVYIESTDNWYEDGTEEETHYKQLKVFPPDHEYPEYTYSRLVHSYLSINHTEKKLKLKTPWDKGFIPAGSAICNTKSGAAYSYIAASNNLMTTQWVKRKSNPTDTTANINQIRYGTEYVKIGCLMNRDVNENTTSYIRNLKFYNVSNKGQTLTTIERPLKIIESGTLKTNNISTVGIADGLIGYWKLENDARDYSGNGYHGESLNVNGTSPYPTGDGYKFERISDSSGGYIRTGLTPQYDAITFTCWIKPETIHSSELASCGDNDLNLTLTNNKPGIYISGMYPTTHLISSTTLPVNQWCFLAFTIENLKETSLGKIYINGSLDSQSNSLSRINGREYINPIGIGTDWDNYTPTGFYNGYIKDFRVYNRILSDEEIKILYEVTNFDSGLKAKITEDGRLYVKGINTCL